MSRFINPYTDFGFKKLFGEEANKELLIDFLNELLPPRHQILALDFKNTSQLPDLPEQRKAIFDIHCKAKSGEHFIVEMQKAKINFFKDRSLFYTTFPIREQAQRGDWDFQLDAIYLIAILDFDYEEADERRKLLRHIQLKDQDGDLFTDKLNFKFIQMRQFHKTEAELVTHFDKWLYFLKNLESMEEIPAILKEPIFEKAFQTAALANLNQEQRDEYEMSRLNYLELNAVVTTAELQGEERKEIQVILRAHSNGKSAKEIADFLEMSEEKVRQIIDRQVD